MAVAEGKRAEIGLGAAKALSLTGARKIAGDMREQIATGADPRQVIAHAPAIRVATVRSFGAFAEQYITSVEAGWKNPVHRQQWRSSLRDHAGSLADVPIDQVETEAVLGLLSQIWLTKPDTASRLRGRIEKIPDAAKALGIRPREATNPAAWRVISRCCCRRNRRDPGRRSLAARGEIWRLSPVRSLVGLDRVAAKTVSGDFLSAQSRSANQVEFINLIVEYLKERGAMDRAASMKAHSRTSMTKA